MFFQRKNSKKVKDSEGSQKKGKDGRRGKNDLFYRAKGGLDALAGSLHSTKNDAETEEIGSHSVASRSKELEQGSEEQGNKDMDAYSAVMDKVKSHPEVMEKVSAVMDKVKSHPEVVEKVKDEVKSLADALHLRRHGSQDKEPESEEKAEEGEAAQSVVDEGASADKTEEPNLLEQAVEEIQAVAAALQQTAPAAETETEIPVEAAAAAETSAEGDKPDETNREVEKDDPKKRLDFAGFFAMLFERFCSPGNKKKD